MNELIRMLDEDYELYGYRLKGQNIIMEIGSTVKSLRCPYCGIMSHKVHSRYQREIQDLPIQGKHVVLLVTTRKMFCSNPGCQNKTFSERHPFVAVNGRKTIRLENSILGSSLDVSSINASKILASEGVTVSKSSICAMLKKNARDCG